MEKRNYELLIEKEREVEVVRNGKESEIQDKEQVFQKEMDDIREKAEAGLKQLK